MKPSLFVYLDLDNTLLNHSAAEEQALEQAMSAVLGNHTGFDSFYQHYQQVNAGLWSDYAAYRLSKEELRDRRFKQSLAQFGWSDREQEFTSVYYQQYRASWQAVSGAQELLTGLQHRGVRVGLLSNGFAEIQREKVIAMGWQNLFCPVILSEETGWHKPDIRLFRFAEQACETEAPRIVYLGDSIASDVDGAAAAGWIPVFFDFLGSGSTPARAAFSIRKLPEFLTVLDALP